MRHARGWIELDAPTSGGAAPREIETGTLRVPGRLSIGPQMSAAMPSFFRFGFRLIIRSRLRLMLDDHTRLDEPAPGPFGQLEPVSAPLLRAHLRQLVRHRARHVALLPVPP